MKRPLFISELPIDKELTLTPILRYGGGVDSSQRFLFDYNQLISGGNLDIDLSVELEQIKIWQKKKLISQKIKVYFGSRLLSESKVKAKKDRKFIGFIFNIVLRKILNSNLLDIKDTQCGFKLYQGNIAKKIFKRLTENGYIHDVEILILLQRSKISVKEIPVEWKHQHGSKINLILDSIIMLKNLLILKKRYDL